MKRRATIAGCLITAALLANAQNTRERCPAAGGGSEREELAAARCYYGLHDAESARQVLERIAAQGPRPAAAAATTAIAAGDLPAAADLISAALARYPQAVELAYATALLEYNRGEIAASQSTLERIPPADRDASSFDLLAWCYHRRGRSADAAAAMRAAVRLEPANGERYAHLAQILLEDKNYREAYAAAVKATEASGGGAPAYRMKAAVETASGMMKQAAASAARAVQLDPRDPEARLLLAVAQQGLWQYTEARATLERAIQEFPNHVRLYISYGRLLLDPGAPWDAAVRESAVSMFEQALARDPALFEAQAALGEYLLKTGRAPRALPHLEMAARLGPQEANVHLMLANAYRLTGREAAAAEQIRLFRILNAPAVK